SYHRRPVLHAHLDAAEYRGVKQNNAPTPILPDQLRPFTRLIDDIDEVSRAQEHRIDIDLVTEPLGALIHTAATPAQESYQVKGVGLQATDVSPPASVTRDRPRPGQGMSNLLANAPRHPPAGRHGTSSGPQPAPG